MAFLYVAEFAGLADVTSPGAFPSQNRGWTHIAGTPPTAEQKLVNTGAAVLSAAFQPNTRMVRLHTDSICSVAFGGTNALAATTSNMRLAANQTEYFGVSPGWFLSVILNT